MPVYTSALPSYLGLWVACAAALGLMLGCRPDAAAAPASRAGLTLCCSADNDLYRVLTQSGCKVQRVSDPQGAVDRAAPGSAVLILADDYPEKLTNIPASLYQAAAEKRLRLYVEYPAGVPGLEFGEPRQTQWERCVVASDGFGDALPKLRILSISGCRFTPVTAADPMLIVGRVAGYDTAVYGLPQQAHPILFRHGDVLVATTKLSGFVTGRYAPSEAWTIIWERIIQMLDPNSKVSLEWTPTVRPAYGPEDRLPADVEKRAFASGVKWYLDSRLLVHPSEEKDVYQLVASGAECRPTPGRGHPVGDGSLGILEGYGAAIGPDGNQVQRVPLRADCNCEVAMALALDSSAHSRKVARNLLDYVFFTSPMCKGGRGNPKHPAFGHVAWGAIHPAWEVANYGDDSARVMLSTLIAAASLKDSRWDEAVMRSLLANLRTTGTLGFRSDRLDMPALEQFGWRHFHDLPTVNCAPHFESYLWACYLWGYRQTGYKPFLDKAKSGIKITMENYPGGWRWQDNMERARMLLCLAWLVRVEDTSEHRAWLDTVATDLLKMQDPCGAIQERIPPGGRGGHYNVPASNEAYGTGETPLIQQDGDPACDQLYTTGFALLGLHEAVAATGDAKLKTAEDRLAGFLCRIQVSSKQHPNLSGAWFRAFDYKRWEYWASSGDAGWGAWSAETGWGTAWIIAVLALRQRNECVWDYTSGSRIADTFRSVMKQMAENDGGPWKPEP